MSQPPQRYLPPRKLKAAKKAAAISEATEIGKLKARRKVKETLSEKLERIFIPMLQKIDPIKALAIFGGTVVVHEIIFKLEAFSGPIQNILLSPNPATAVLLYGLIEKVMGTEQLPSSIREEYFRTKGATSDFIVWCVALAIAYFAIRHGAELLGVAKSFIGIAGSLA